MIPITKPSGTGFYCIDQTEVTNQQYGAFLGSSPSAQTGDCAWNTSFSPATMSVTCPSPLPYDPVGKAFYPVSCVDWCDALAYCQAVGKHLCGAINGGGALAPGSSADANQSQWYRACSQSGARRYPYGSLYQGTYCNGVDAPTSGSVPVNSMTQCQGGYPNLYDMSGNVREWENACSGSGQTGTCAQRGGGYLDPDNPPPDTTLECSSAGATRRDTRDRTLGFRCCWDG